MITATPLTRHWPAFAALASLAMLGAAWSFQIFGGLAPCPLCLRQREVYWAAAGVAALGLIALRVWPFEAGARALCVLLGAIFLAGAGVAGYHAGVEFGWFPAPAACAGGDVDALFRAGKTLAEMLEAGPKEVASCAAVPWSFLGLSMAAWNFLVALGLAGVSLVSAFAQPKDAV